MNGMRLGRILPNFGLLLVLSCLIWGMAQAAESVDCDPLVQSPRRAIIALLQMGLDETRIGPVELGPLIAGTSWSNPFDQKVTDIRSVHMQRAYDKWVSQLSEADRDEIRRVMA